MPSNDKTADIETLTDVISTLSFKPDNNCGIFMIVFNFSGKTRKCYYEKRLDFMRLYSIVRTYL